jgi:hypothetical protein
MRTTHPVCEMLREDERLARRQKRTLPWLFPLALLLVVLAVAFAPNAVTGFVGIVVFLTLGYGGVALYYRRHQQRSDHDDIAG